MKPISINILGSYVDGSIYLGRLFLVQMDGVVSSVSMDELITSVNAPDISNVLQLAFLRNDWLSNPQGRGIFRIPGLLEKFKQEWVFAADTEVAIDSKKLNIKKHLLIPDAPIFDIKAYGLKLYFGNRNGLYESQLEADNNEFRTLWQPKKIFDSRTSYISAKSGELMVSSNSDGLFRGNVGLYKEKSKVNERAVADKSLRTGWASFDLINYESQNNFVYYVNEVTKPDKNKSPRVPYSANDETSEKREIKNFGIDKHSQIDLMPNALRDRTIKYSFNSSNFCFFLTSENSLYRTSLIKDKNAVHLSRKVAQDDFEELLTLTGRAKIISSSLVPSGTILETVSSVLLTTSGEKPRIIHDHPIYALRTFLTSRRFRNLVLVFHETGATLHSLFPIELSDERIGRAEPIVGGS
jgi:hypothetical protein